MSGREYQCEACGGTFEAEWSEEEAAAEAKALFGIENIHDKEQAACVCDDCFNRMKARGLF